MSGIASLFGGNSAKTDRKQELDARDQLRNVFSYALPEGKSLEGGGTNLQDQAGDYFGKLLRSGRAEAQQDAAPAINAQLEAADAAKRREAITGTGRTGGTVEQDRMAGAKTDADIANTVNSTMLQNKAIGAQGAEQVGSDKMRQALGFLGMSGSQIEALLKNTESSRVDSQNIHNQTFADAGGDIGQLLTLAFLS